MNSLWIHIMLFLKCCSCNSQIGPDPWDYVNIEKSQLSSNEFNVPSDLKTVPQNSIYSENSAGLGEWFYKRILAIVLKGGKVRTNDNDEIDVSLHMKFDQEKWTLLNEYLATNKPFSENMFRRSIGYIEDSICKPTITEKIAVAWSEYVQFYLMEYKVQLTWLLTFIAMKVTVIWLWRYLSHKQLILLVFLFLYLYEGFVSYKEAEQQEVERFISAVDKCKWFIWSSDCEVPPPDPLIFLKHMKPLKIGIRMFTTLISEPMILISDNIQTIIHGITDGLWYPIDKITYGILVVVFNILLIFLLVMVLFNFILNIPFNLSFFGLINLGVKQRNRTFMNGDAQAASSDNSDRISGATLHRILDVCTHALSTVEVKRNGDYALPLESGKKTNLRRSASAGRLTSLGGDIYAKRNMLTLDDNASKSKLKHRGNGSGDAW